MSAAVGCVLVAMGLLFPSVAAALTKNVFSASFSGSGPSALTNPTDVAVDNSSGPSRGDVYVANPAVNERQEVAVSSTATTGTFTLTFEGQTTAPIPYNAHFDSVQAALQALPGIGSGNLNVLGGRIPNQGAREPYYLEFDGTLAETDIEQLTADSSQLNGATISVRTTATGGRADDIEKFSPTGQFILMLGKEVNRTAVEAHAPEAQQNLCTVASDDACQPGTPGSSPGAFLGTNETNYLHRPRLYLAVDNSAGPSAGDLYVGDPGDSLVTKFTPSGELVSTWGNGGQIDGAGVPFGPFFLVKGLYMEGIAVRPDGILVVMSRMKRILEFAQDGSFFAAAAPQNGLGMEHEGIAVDGAEHIYEIESKNFTTGGRVSVDSLALSPGHANFFVPSTDRHLFEGLEGSVAHGLGASGLAIDPSTRSLYVAREGGTVAHFPSSCEPSVSTCEPFDVFGATHLSLPEGIALDTATGAVYVADPAARSVAVFAAVPYLPDALPSPAEGKTPTEELLKGEVDPAEVGPITACHFQYVTEVGFRADAAEGGDGWSAAATLPCEPQVFSTPTQVSAQVPALTHATTYRYRIHAENATGINTSFSATFTTLPLAPQVEAESTGEAFADTALIRTRIDPGGGDTTYQVEYVTQQQFEQGEFANADDSPSLDAGEADTFQSLLAHLSGLKSDTTYHYRVVAENAYQTTTGPTHTFTTLPFTVPDDTCPNAHVRQQTATAGLLDCRAYELVSAADTAGYDVESNLIPGQSPLPGFPEARAPSGQPRVLYGIHDGGIPGTAEPTNRGVDPYVATRTESGWQTEYVGIPANATPSTSPFSSTLLSADAGLGTFAFGGAGLCAPCFADGSTGIPLRRPDGSLLQGMAGSLDPGPSATPDGFIASPLSADGTHLLFGSTSLFAEGGNDETGDVSIYDRNLETNETHVVSNQPGTEDFPEPLSCLQGAGKCDAAEGDANGISELDISSDGSRILLGQKVSEDSAGNPYYHLYMDVDDSVNAIDLTPGVISEPGGPGDTEGVLYDGMTSDGSMVFFTTKNALTGEDEDASPDIYRAAISPSGAMTLNSLSSGTGEAGEPGNADSCDPLANSAHKHWNSLDPDPNCGAVAIAGGGGVASADGSVYFLSPELLDGGSNGTQNAPNLYLAQPGQAPHYITTLESVLSGSQPPKAARSFTGNFGSFAAAAGLAVDHSSGDVYVLDDATSTVQRFDSSGSPVSFNFASGSKEAAGSRLTGADTPGGAFGDLAGLGPNQLAVDQSNGDLYVPDLLGGAIDVFDASGNYLPAKQIAVPGDFPTGVAIDSSNGYVYVSGFSGAVYVYDSSGNPLTSFPASGSGSVAVAPGGAAIYVTSGSQTDQYDSAGNLVKTFDPDQSFGVAVDSSDNNVYVDESDKVVQFDPAGNQLRTVGSTDLSGSAALAVDPEGDLFATNAAGTAVAGFGPTSLIPDPSIDSPIVLHAVAAPATRNTADFQTTPDGGFAAFPSTLALAGRGEETAGHTAIFRYDAQAEELLCVACTPTGFPSQGDSALASNGLSLTDDGRVFFDSTDRLSAYDTDGRADVYEWSRPGVGDCQPSSPSFATTTGACLALISAGTSTFDSGLLSAGANGTDAYFFTRDSLSPQDKNGPTMKIYDAREEGGFPFLFPAVTCKASDECHGAASPAPGPIPVGSATVTPPPAPSPCRRGFLRKHGNCVRKHHHKKSHHRRAADHNRGARK